MPYTGNLTRLAQKPDALKLPAPSPRHGVREGAQELHRQERVVPEGTGAEFQGTDFDKVVQAGHGMLLDTPASAAGTPPGTADTESPWHIDYTKGSPYTSGAILSARGAAIAAGGAGSTTTVEYGADNAMLGRQHDGTKDRGWVRALFWWAPMWRDTNLGEEILAPGPASSVEGPGGVGGAKYGRGINSLGENNPDGWRNGNYRFPNWSTNTVFQRVHRTIGTQQLQPRDIYTPGPQQRMVSSMITPPSLPRDAPNPDDVITANSNYSSSPSSVIGGF